MKVFVSRLPTAWGEGDVRRYFEPHGEIASISLFTKESRSKPYQGLGCAYITFTRRSEAETTIRTLSRSVKGRYIFIQLARAPCNYGGQTEKLRDLECSRKWTQFRQVRSTWNM